MQCDRCEAEAVIHTAYSGAHLCEQHFIQSVERRVKSRIREDNMVDQRATPENQQHWLIGLSGGKDSVVLTKILHETFAEDPRIKLIALTIHEGIEGYRDKSVSACEELTEDIDIEHVLVSYNDEYGVKMDEVAADDPENMAPCAYCGVLRRDVLTRYADELDADLLLTGHNLDDEAETALMNIFEGDVNQIAKHFSASLGAVGERPRDDLFIPRVKPLRDIPEQEVALYAHLQGLPAHITECPHAEESFRAEVQELLYQLEEDHPGTRHSIMAGYEKLAQLAAKEEISDNSEESTTECRRCGNPTERGVCRTCSLLDAINGNRKTVVESDQ